jgi:signal transduction histidine kinase
MFMLIISLLVSIIITTIAGNRTLRPLNKIIDATKEIAAGNFDIRLENRYPYEFSRLTKSVNEMAKELGSIETLRDDFVSTISHEYKTPIVSIKGFAKLIKKGNLSKERQDEYLDIIISESERLTQLSNNVLLLSKVTSSDRMSDITEFLLDEQLRKAILLLESRIKTKNITLDMELDSCTIQANEELLNQVWINLLTNAIKFTKDNGTITLKLVNDREKVQVVIEDNGIGMDEEVTKHIFDKFYQGDSSHSSQGNGLGLALVKRIVDLCNGSIEVYSELDKGSKFIVELPVNYNN